MKKKPQFLMRTVVDMVRESKTTHKLTLSCGHFVILTDGVKRGEVRSQPKRRPCYRCATELKQKKKNI